MYALRVLCLRTYAAFSSGANVVFRYDKARSVYEVRSAVHTF
jgi:hypothetical protein